MMALGLALSGREVRALAVDASGAVVARASRAYDAGGRAEAVREACREVRAEPAAVGVATPAGGDAVPDDVLAALEERTGRSPVLVRTGHALALAEAWCGAAPGCDNLIVFAAGDDVVAGILVGGRPLTGAHGDAGAVAWLALNPVEREDYRRHGGLAAEVAAAGIVRRLIWRIKSGDASALARQVNGESGGVTADDVFQAARRGDGVSLSILRDTARYVGMAVANLTTVIDPECVVLGGALAGSGDLMHDAIHAECSRRLSPAQCARFRLVRSTLGDDAAAVGAARAASLHA